VIVLDASAVVEWLLQSAKAGAVDARAFSQRSRSAMRLICLMSKSHRALRRLVARQGHLGQPRLAGARGPGGPAADSVLRTIGCSGRIWELRHNLTAYDAAYVALAEALEVPLLTCDRRIKGASGHAAQVEVI
jgi:predicted nucleic acid-binding protein